MSSINHTKNLLDNIISISSFFHKADLHSKQKKILRKDKDPLSCVLSTVRSGSCIYSVISSEYLTEQNDTVTVYGIEIREGDNICRAEDISPCREEVMRLAALMAEEELSPEHLCDVAEDFLADKTQYKL